MSGHSTARGEWGPAAPALAAQENSLGSCCCGVELVIPCLQGFMKKPRGLLVLKTAPVALGMSPLCPQELVLEPSTGTGRRQLPVGWQWSPLDLHSPSQGCSPQGRQKGISCPEGTGTHLEQPQVNPTWLWCPLLPCSSSPIAVALW